MTKHKKYKNGDRFIPAAEFWNRMIKQGKVSHFKEGGEFNGLKQYNAPKHEQGGQNIDVNGNPTMMNPKGQVEGTENKIKYFNLPDKTGQEYIFSDANKTSLELKKFMKKFKKNHDPDNDDLSRNMMELKAKDLEFKNEAINASKQQENIPQQFNFGGGFNPILEMAFDVFKNNVINDGKEISDMSRFDYNQNNNLQPRPDIVNIPDKLPQISPFNKIPGTGNIPDKLPQLNPLNFNAVPDVPVLNNNSNVSDNTSNPNISMPEISNEQLLSGIGYGIKGVQAFSPATKENLMLPDFSKSDEKFGAMNANLDTARNEALSASNLMSNLNRSSVSNFNQYKNAQSQNFSNLQKNLGNIGLNEQQLRNAVLGQQGQYEQGKATLNRNLADDIQVRNLQNQARTRDKRAGFANDIIGEADRLDAIKNLTELANASREEFKLLLNNMFPDFEIDNETIDLLQKYSRGEIDETELKNNIINYKNNGK